MTRSRRVWIALGAALLSGLLALAWFSSRPEMPVLVGTEPLALTVPASYQASIFPAFGACVAAALFDAVERSSPWAGRAALLGACVALAALRLLAVLPLSGHALFAAALSAHDWLAPRSVRTPLGVPLALGSLLMTAWYKLLVWGDAPWLAVSIVVGLAIGGASARVSRDGR